MFSIDGSDGFKLEISTTDYTVGYKSDFDLGPKASSRFWG